MRKVDRPVAVRYCAKGECQRIGRRFFFVLLTDKKKLLEVKVSEMGSDSSSAKTVDDGNQASAHRIRPRPAKVF